MCDDMTFPHSNYTNIWPGILPYVSLTAYPQSTINTNYFMSCNISKYNVDDFLKSFVTFLYISMVNSLTGQRQGVKLTQVNVNNASLMTCCATVTGVCKTIWPRLYPDIDRTSLTMAQNLVYFWILSIHIN